LGTAHEHNHPLDLQAQVEVVSGRLMLLDEQLGADATDCELLMTLDTRAFARNDVADERHQLLHGVGRPLARASLLSAAPNPLQTARGPGGHSSASIPPPAAARSARFRARDAITRA
jgi:hypothetical protein